MKSSLLETIATHEESLQATVDSVEAEAAAALETAKAEATALLVQAHQDLEEELAGLRSNGAQAREDERIAIETAATTKVETMRENSVTKRSALVKEILGIILPGK